MTVPAWWEWGRCPPDWGDWLSISGAAASLSRMDRPDVSIVIVNYNALAYTRACLATLAEGAAGRRWEAIVVDNASPERGATALAEEFAGVRVIRRGQNGGFAVGANTGIAQARAEYVLLLNPDTEVRPGAITTLVRYLSAHPEAGIVGPRLENPDGTLQLSCRRFPTLWTGLFNRYSLLTRLLPGNRHAAGYLMTDWRHDATRSVDWLSGAAMLLSKRALRRTGLFDEGYFFAIEDVDLCRRMRDAGFAVVYLPEAVVMHHIGASSRTLAWKALVGRHRGMWRYYCAHLRPKGQSNSARLKALDGAVAAGIVARCALQLAATTASRSARPRPPASLAPPAPPR